VKPDTEVNKLLQLIEFRNERAKTSPTASPEPYTKEHQALISRYSIRLAFLNPNEYPNFDTDQAVTDELNVALENAKISSQWLPDRTALSDEEFLALERLKELRDERAKAAPTAPKEPYTPEQKALIKKYMTHLVAHEALATDDSYFVGSVFTTEAITNPDEYPNFDTDPDITKQLDTLVEASRYSFTWKKLFHTAGQTLAPVINGAMDLYMSQIAGYVEAGKHEDLGEAASAAAMASLVAGISALTGNSRVSELLTNPNVMKVASAASFAISKKMLAEVALSAVGFGSPYLSKTTLGAIAAGTGLIGWFLNLYATRLIKKQT